MNIFTSRKRSCAYLSTHRRGGGISSMHLGMGSVSQHVYTWVGWVVYPGMNSGRVMRMGCVEIWCGRGLCEQKVCVARGVCGQGAVYKGYALLLPHPLWQPWEPQKQAIRNLLECILVWLIVCFDLVRAQFHILLNIGLEINLPIAQNGEKLSDTRYTESRVLCSDT